MESKFAQVSVLRNSILDDVFKGFDTARQRWLRKVVQPFVWPSANRFAKLATTFDQYVVRSGFHQAMRQILPNFVSGVEVRGAEHVPEEGPLLVVSNHPGTFDSLVIAASLPRDDLNIIAAGFSVLKSMPATSRHLIFASTDTHERMGVIRSALRHLKTDGALLIFPAGRMEPDPAVLPGAPEAMGAWSPSLELFLRHVPQTKALITIVSDVFVPGFLRNPLIRLWRGVRDPQPVAEVLQVAVQMLFPKIMRLKPRISFSIPKSIEELRHRNGSAGSVLASIIEEARRLLADHCLPDVGK